MAIDSLVDQVNAVLDALKNGNYENLTASGGSAQPWNGLTSAEIADFVNSTLDLVREASEKDLIRSLSFSHLNNLVSHLNNFNAQYASVRQLQLAQVTNQHHNALNQLQGVDNILRSSGLFAIVKLNPDMEQRVALLDSQIKTSNQTSTEIQALASQVKELLDPSLASSLSSTFDDRRQNVSKQKWFWFAIFVLSVLGSVWLTMDITDALANASKSIQENVKTDDPVTSEIASVGFIWFLRLLLLVPAYFSVAFSVSQLLRERNFEENYAHKSSIAKTLPSYKELVTDPTVKDEIMASATKVVFSPPFSKTEGKKRKKEDDSSAIEQIKELSEIIRNFNLSRND